MQKKIAAALFSASVLVLSCRSILLPASTDTPVVGKPLELQGNWQIAFDPEDIGEEEKWYKEKPVDVETVTVPGAWQQAKCGAGYEGIAWYYKEFHLPADTPRHVDLRFSDVNYRAKVWLNEEFIGEHEGGYIPFSFSVGSPLHRGLKNQLVVRVTDTPRLAYADGLNLYQVPHGGEVCFLNYGGICGPVQLVAHGEVWLREVTLVPDLQNETITANCRIAAGIPDEPVVLIATATDAGDIGVEYGSYRQEIAPGATEAAVEIKLRQILPWSPTHPFLYRISVRLVSGQEILDEFSDTIGLRSFDIVDGDFYLNGRRLVLKAVLDQPTYPNTICRPPTPQWCRQQVKMIKEAGFNAVDSGMAPASEDFLREADRQGLLVLQRLPVGKAFSGDPLALKSRMLAQAEGVVRRDRNHTSIVAWGISSGRQSDATEPAAELSRRIRELDATRPILDGVSMAYPAGSAEGQPYESISWHPPTPVSDQDRLQLRQCLSAVPPGRLVVSRYGYGGITNFESVLETYGSGTRYREDSLYFSETGYKIRKSVAAWPLDEKFETFEAFRLALQQGHAQALKQQNEALAADPAVDMLCVAQWRDCVGYPGAGLTDVFGGAKPALEIFKTLNSPTRLLLFTPAASGYIGDNIRYQAVVIDETATKGPAELHVELIDADGAVIRTENVLPTLTGDRVQRLQCREIGPFRSEGLCTLRATLRYFGTTLGTAETHVTAVSHEATKIGVPATVYDPGGVLKRYLAGQELELLDLETGEHITPVIIVTELGDAPPPVIARFFAAVRMGAFGIVLSPPGQEKPLNCSGMLSPTLVENNPPPQGFYVYAFNHPLFEGLPAGDLLGAAYRNILPLQSMAESNHFRPREPWQSLAGAVNGCEGFLGHCLLLKPEENGTIMLSTFRLAENLDSDPVAARLLANMIRYAERLNPLGRQISPAPADTAPISKEYENRLTQHRKLQRQFGLIGPWPLCPKSGTGSNFDVPFAPEKNLAVDGNAAIHGEKAGTEVATLDCRHRLQLPAAFRRRFIVGYACATIRSPGANVAQLVVRSRTPIKAWFNGREKYLARDPLVRLDGCRPSIREIDSRVRLRKGDNRLLIKFAWSGEPSFVEVRILDDGEDLPELEFSPCE